jgi:sulfate transport system substrate-binding protein
VFEQRLLPAFRERYRRDTGKTVRVDASFLASGAQTRALVGGFEADVAVLALEGDMDKLVAAKLVSSTWRDRTKSHGFVTSSLVAFGVRTGNPKHIVGWADLARPGVEVLVPSPKTSGGAMWNVSALLGASLRGRAGVAANDMAAASNLLERVLKNVLIFDKGGRESVITFEKGVGDVAVTYESEIVTARRAGRVYDEVIPESTLRIDIPGATIDAYVDERGTRAAAEALLAFLETDEAQRALADYGFRAVDAPPPPGVDLWTIEYLGGWSKVMKDIYAPGGVFPKAWESVDAR